MKEYMQPEVELVQFVSESITIMEGVGSAESNNISTSEIVIP